VSRTGRTRAGCGADRGLVGHHPQTASPRGAAVRGRSIVADGLDRTLAKADGFFGCRDERSALARVLIGSAGLVPAPPTFVPSPPRNSLATPRRLRLLRTPAPDELLPIPSLSNVAHTVRGIVTLVFSAKSRRSPRVYTHMAANCTECIG
jgi:hypothetical protein